MFLEFMFYAAFFSFPDIKYFLFCLTFSHYFSDLLMFGGSAMFDVSVDIHPFNSSQYIILVKLPSHSNLPALFPVPGDSLYPTLDPTQGPTTQYPTPDNVYPNLGPNSLYPKTKSAFQSSGFKPSSSSSDSHGIFSDPKPGSNLNPINMFSSFNHKNKVSSYLSVLPEKILMNYIYRVIYFLQKLSDQDKKFGQIN